MSDIALRASQPLLLDGLSGRVERWEVSARLVRSLFGYGSDTFQYVFPLEAPPSLMWSTSQWLPLRTTAAHNDPLNRLVELGVFGLIASRRLPSARCAYCGSGCASERRGAWRRC